MSVLSRRRRGQKTEILVCETTDAYASLEAEDGRPVWPVVGKARDVLRQACAPFGAELLDAEARPAGTALGTGVVMGAASVARAGRLYAHLTGRRWLCNEATGVAATTPESTPDVVVICGAAPDPDLVQRLMLLPQGAAIPGIIWGRTHEELYARVLVASAYATSCGAARRYQRIDLVSESPNGVVSASGRRLVGGKATTAEIAAALRERASVMTISAHGEPWSIALSPNVALCMRHEPPAGEDDGRAPYCVASGFCPRVGRPVAEAMSSALLDPDIVAARVLVIAACRAVPVASEATDARWAYLPILLANPSVGAVLASPELATISYRQLSGDLLPRLEAGIPVGQALLQFESTTTARRLQQRLLLFGDPRTCAAPPVPGWDEPPLGEQVEADAISSPDVEVLRALESLVRADHPDSANRALALSDTLDAFESCSTGPDGPGGDAAAVRRAVLAFVATTRGRTTPNEASATGFRRVDAPLRCPGCGWIVRPDQWRLNDLVRTIISCPRCMDIAHLPEGSDLDLDVTLPCVVLRGQLPTHDWAAALYVAPAVATQIQVHAWPAAASGSPERSLTLPHCDWPAGPLQVRLVLIAGLTLYAVGRVRRAPPVVRPGHFADRSVAYNEASSIA